MPNFAPSDKASGLREISQFVKKELNVMHDFMNFITTAQEPKMKLRNIVVYIYIGIKSYCNHWILKKMQMQNS